MNEKSNLSEKIKKDNEISYKNYFEGTKQLKGNFNDPDLKINSNVRIFRNSKKDGGYDEIFENFEQKLFQINNNQISSLFPPNSRGYYNRVGFRYYKFNPIINNTNDNPYFTLIFTGYRKFIILEKESEVKDNEGNSFKIDNLDCFDIILSIIKNKLKDDKGEFLNYKNSNTELLGFIYAVKTLNNNNINGFEIINPYFPNPLKKETMIEDFDFNKEKTYLEPILYNNHVSLLMFSYKEFRKNNIQRKNILFEMNNNHYTSFINEDPIFTEEMRIKTDKFPRNTIQLGNSCSLWFYATMITLLKNKVEFPLNNNLLYKIIQKAYDLLDIKERDIIDSKIESREKENISRKGFISYKIALRPFIDYEGLIKQFAPLTNILPDEHLGSYQNKIIAIRKIINLYELNYKYYYVVFKKEIFDRKIIDKLRYYITNVENYFYNIINAKREHYYYSNKGLDINSNILLEKQRQIDKAEALFEKLVKNSFIPEQLPKIKLYNEKEIMNICSDEFDKFLVY